MLDFEVPPPEKNKNEPNLTQNSKSESGLTQGQREHYEELIRKDQKRQEQDSHNFRDCLIGGGVGAVAGGALGSFIPLAGTGGGAAVGAIGGCFLAIGLGHTGDKAGDAVEEVPNKLNEQMRKQRGYRGY